MEEQMQLAVVTPIDELRTRTIKSNAEALLPIVKQRAAVYRATQYGITQERMCREHRANLNKFLKAITDDVKAIGEANAEPFKVFCAEVEPIQNEVKETIAALDAQLEEMEMLWRTNNLSHAKALYDAIIGATEYSDWLPWEKILLTKKTDRTSYEDFFGNKGSWNYSEGQETTSNIEELKKAGKQVVEVLDRFVTMTNEKVDVIVSLDYPDMIKKTGIEYIGKSYDPVKRGYDLEGALATMKRMKQAEDDKAEAVERARREAEAKAEAEKQAAIEAERKKAEAEKAAAIAEAEKKFKANVPAPTEPQQMTMDIPAENEPVYTIRFEMTATKQQAINLRAFCDSQGITLKPIK